MKFFKNFINRFYLLILFGLDNEFSNNLLSDEEGTSQETLYSPLHNCSDDIKYLVERLSL